MTGTLLESIITLAPKVLLEGKSGNPEGKS